LADDETQAANPTTEKGAWRKTPMRPNLYPLRLRAKDYFEAAAEAASAAAEPAAEPAAAAESAAEAAPEAAESAAEAAESAAEAAESADEAASGFEQADRLRAAPATAAARMILRM
jgi:flagellar biosynthesis/type III secretory pathway protein FliH